MRGERVGLLRGGKGGWEREDERGNMRGDRIIQRDRTEGREGEEDSEGERDCSEGEGEEDSEGERDCSEGREDRMIQRDRSEGGEDRMIQRKSHNEWQRVKCLVTLH